MSQKVDEKYLDALEKFDLSVMTYDERMELIRLARVGLAAGEMVICPACKGFGYKPEGLQPTCGQCAGSGKVKAPSRRYSEWTTDSPTEEGWYWYFGGGEDEPYPEYVYLDEKEGGLCINVLGFSLRVDQEERHWLGPLPVPEPPKDGA